MHIFTDVYNALTVHAIVNEKADIKSVLDIPSFWSSHAYQIGDQVYTLDDMEHGILRGVNFTWLTLLLWLF